MSETQESGSTFPRAISVRRALVTRMVASVPRSFSPATDSSVTDMQAEKINTTIRKGKSPAMTLRAMPEASAESLMVKTNVLP